MWHFSFGKRTIELTHRKFAAVVAVGFVSLLLAHVLILPPFESFDETAHYSYVSQLWDRHEIPDFLTTPLDAS